MAKIFILFESFIDHNSYGYDENITNAKPILSSLNKKLVNKIYKEKTDELEAEKAEHNKWFNILNQFIFVPKHKVVTEHHISKKKLIRPEYIPVERNPKIPDRNYANMVRAAQEKFDKNLAEHLEYMNSINGVNEKINAQEYDEARRAFIVYKKIPADIADRWLKYSTMHFYESNENENKMYYVDSCDYVV